MTTQQPEALYLADELELGTFVPNVLQNEAALRQRAAAELRRLHAYCQQLESQVILDCMTHVQNPAEIEHVAGDVSKNGAGLNMSTQHARITELESQLAQRFYAADVATAAAQGFRDGATAPAQPGAEPAKPIGYLNPKVLGPDGKIDAHGVLTYSSMPCGSWTFPFYAAAPTAAAQPVAEPAKSADMSDEREAFEAWLRSVWTAGYGCQKCDSGKYVHGEAQRFWECWQARASHGQTPSGAGGPTEQQILEAAFAPAQPAAQQGVAYAELPDEVVRLAQVAIRECQYKGNDMPQDWMESAMRACRLIAASHGQAPAQPGADMFPMSGDEDDSDLGLWQSGETKPTIEGTYLREFDEGQGISEFNEGKWLRDGFFPSDIQDARWRGRTSPKPTPTPQSARQRSDLVPGVMHCAKCKFQLNRVTLCVSDGNAYAGDNKTEPCPNGCGPLWPVTWEQEAKNCWKALEEMHERLMAATALAAAPQPSYTAQAESVQEDAARLDYLHSTGSTIEMLPGEVDFYPMRFRVGGLHSAVSPNLREAIDAARKQGGA